MMKENSDRTHISENDAANVEVTQSMQSVKVENIHILQIDGIQIYHAKKNGTNCR